MLTLIRNSVTDVPAIGISNGQIDRPHHHFYNVDTGELADIDAAPVEVHGLPALPEGMVTEGVDIIVRVRSSKLL